jgi:hypothetical protein
MKTFAITSYTDYGQVIDIINADTLDRAKELTGITDLVWRNYDIEEIDTKSEGIVFVSGGSY